MGGWGPLGALMNTPLAIYLRRSIGPLMLRNPVVTACLVIFAVWYFGRKANVNGAPAGTDDRALAGRRDQGADIPGGRAAAPYTGRLSNLQGVRTITLVTENIVLRRQGGGALGLDEGVLPLLRELAQSAELFLVTRVLDDAEQSLALRLLRDSGLVSGGAARLGDGMAKALFCSTVAGTQAMARQLEPQLHIDTDVESLLLLAKLMKQTRLLHVDGGVGRDARLPPSVATTPSANAYFGLA